MNHSSSAATHDQNMFFFGIPEGDQKAIVLAWAEKHGGRLPYSLAQIRLSPGTVTAGQWLETPEAARLKLVYEEAAADAARKKARGNGNATAVIRQAFAIA